VRRCATVLLLGLVGGAIATPAQAGLPTLPSLANDVKASHSRLPSLTRPVPTNTDPDAGYSQPDTQIEPSIAVNPANPRNAVAVFQENRFADGGAYTTGYATTFDAGKTWRSGEIPKLTMNGNQGGKYERASDPVVAFGPHNTVYTTSITFDMTRNNGLGSGLTVSMSPDGGRHWKDPVLIQDDNLTIVGPNDKEWLVVDTSSAPGHHLGRVYVVWDRIVPVEYNYCDHDCDHLENWLPDFQTVPGLMFPGQGLGAYPLVLREGGLGIVIETISGGIPGVPPDVRVGGEINYILAPEAGSTPYPLPLAFLPPIDISGDRSNGVRGQRASGGIPAAAVDPRSGTIYAVWDDGRFRADAANDAVLSRSFDNGLTWTPPQRVNRGSTDDDMDHYNITVAVGARGTVHIAWRQRDESGPSPTFSPFVDTYYVESFDGGNRFTRPLKVDRVPSNIPYDAFSEGGAFEGDYNQVASAGGYTYIVRGQGGPAYRGEKAALLPADSQSLRLARRGHQHQSTWVAVVRDRR